MPEIVSVAVRDLIALDHSVAQYRIEGYSALTRARYKEIWQTFVCFCAPKDAWAATPLDIVRWAINEVVEWGLSPATVRARVTALKAYAHVSGAYQVLRLSQAAWARSDSDIASVSVEFPCRSDAGHRVARASSRAG